MRILITGAGGKLGTCLQSLLTGDSHQVLALSKEELDICDSSHVIETITTLAPEAVVNCAAYTDVDGAEQNRDLAFAVNETGAANLASACAHQEPPPQFVQISTDFVFDGRASDPYRETDATAPLTVYGQSKLAGETVVQHSYPAALILRTAWLFGGTGSDFVRAVLNRARRGDPLSVVVDQIGSPTWVDDLALAIVRLLTLPVKTSGILHITNTGACSRYELAQVALSAAQIEATIEPIQSENLPPGAPRPAWSVLDGSRFESLSGCRLRPWREAVSLFVQQLEPPLTKDS